MIFTESELICFNSLIDGKVIMGTHFKAPLNPGEDYLRQTVDSLKSKGFLNKDENPNELFAVAMKMLKAYKRAKSFLFINKARIALEDNKVTVLTEMSNGYDLMRTDKVTFFQALLQQTPYLLQADKGVHKMQTMKPDVWSNSIKNDTVLYDNMWMHKFNGNKMQETQVMYRVGEQGYIYSPDKEELLECGPRDMRVLLMNLFEIQKAG